MVQLQNASSVSPKESAVLKHDAVTVPVNSFNEYVRKLLVRD